MSVSALRCGHLRFGRYVPVTGKGYRTLRLSRRNNGARRNCRLLPSVRAVVNTTMELR